MSLYSISVPSDLQVAFFPSWYQSLKPILQSTIFECREATLRISIDFIFILWRPIIMTESHVWIWQRLYGKIIKYFSKSAFHWTLIFCQSANCSPLVSCELFSLITMYCHHNESSEGLKLSSLTEAWVSSIKQWMMLRLNKPFTDESPYLS